MKISLSEKSRLYRCYGPWAVVTGASSGIGLELATRLAESGLNLLLNARDEHRLSSVKTDLESRYGVEIRTIATDVSSQEGIEALFAATRDLEIGLLIVSAGYGTSGLFLHASLDNEINMLRVNCEALLVLTHHFAKAFAAQQRGGIILMSSMVAFQGTPYAAHYAATKAYVQSLAEALAVELRPNGVDILAAAPGPVASRFAARAGMKMNMFLSPEQVGIPILKALGRRGTVLPGMLTKFLVFALRTVPRWIKVHIMAIVMGGMTKHRLTTEV